MAELADRKRPRPDNDVTPRKSKKAKEAKKRAADDAQIAKDEEEDSQHQYIEAVESGDDEKSKKSKKDKAEKKDKKDGKEKMGKKDKKDKDRKDKKDKKTSHSSTAATPAKTKGRPDAAATAATADPADPVFPFYTQTVSLWIPLYPVGFDRPITSAATQHLAGLVNHYAPQLGGYLLAYRNVNLSEASVRADPNNPPTDSTPATLTAVDEYAVGFGWMTADVDLFVPSRGAWLEGSVILQNEGSVGVNCWEKFNASIEAARLPRGWQYVELEDVPEAAEAAEAAETATPDDEAAGDDHENMEMDEDPAPQEDAQQKQNQDAESVAPLQATGYWADENGRPVEGTIRFRIKDFDVGLAGDTGYLAIEGTMLGEDEERALRAQERARKSGRDTSYGGRAGAKPTRRLPEFSITQFGKEDEEEESGRRVELYKGSRPGTPDD